MTISSPSLSDDDSLNPPSSSPESPSQETEIWNAESWWAELQTLSVPLARGTVKWFWSSLTLGLAATLATSGLGVWVLLAMIAPAAENDCTHLHPTLHAQTPERAVLVCLQAAIAAGDTTAIPVALAWVGRWGPTHPLYNESQELLKIWSHTLLDTASAHQKTGRIAEAIALMEHIPFTSPLYPKAQRLLLQLHRTGTRRVGTHYPSIYAAKDIQPEHPVVSNRFFQPRSRHQSTQRLSKRQLAPAA